MEFELLLQGASLDLYVPNINPNPNLNPKPNLNLDKQIVVALYYRGAGLWCSDTYGLLYRLTLTLTLTLTLLTLLNPTNPNRHSRPTHRCRLANLD